MLFIYDSLLDDNSFLKYIENLKHIFLIKNNIFLFILGEDWFVDMIM